MNTQIAKSNWFTKALKIGAVVLLAAVVLVPAAPARADSNAKQIWFDVGGKNFNSLQILGNNQYNDMVIWPSGDPDLNFKTITFTDGWWWQGSIVLSFYVQDLGWRGCVIKDLDTSVDAPYVSVNYDDTYGCSRDIERTGDAKNLFTDDNFNQYFNSGKLGSYAGCFSNTLAVNVPMMVYSCLKASGARYLPYLPSYMQ
jgi:hypothetical protein